MQRNVFVPLDERKIDTLVRLARWIAEHLRDVEPTVKLNDTAREAAPA